MTPRWLTFLLAAGLLCGAVPLVRSEVGTNNAVAATQDAQTVVVGSTNDPAADVLIQNDSTSANELYFRLFSCGETVAAATTASVRLEKGESRSYRYSASSEGGNGYCALSIVCATGETATARVEWK